jgi:hypothetical protein
MLRNYGEATERGYARREQHMQIGKPVRTIIVEPLELPVQDPKAEPEPANEPQPAEAPVSR